MPRSVCQNPVSGIPSPGGDVPATWIADIDHSLISQEAIRERVHALGHQIEKDFAGKELVIVALLTGTVPFLADLIRNICIPLKLDFMGVSSYREGTTSGNLVYTKELTLDVRDHNVLVVDDILDTGKTLDAVLAKLQELSPATLDTCVLLEKRARREKNIEAQYVGFDIPDEFVVGYGLDYGECFRNMPFIGVLKPEVYS